MSRSPLRNCCFFGSTAVGLTGLSSGVSAAGAAVGGAILNAAGWTVNGAAVVKLATVAGAAAAGSAVIAGPIACCAAGLMTVGYSSDRNAASGASLSADVLLSGAFGATGAAMLGLSKLQIGYVAAATAAGAPIIIVGAGVIAGVAMCFAAACAGEESRHNPYGRARIGSANAPFTGHEELVAYPVRPNGEPDFSKVAPVLGADGKPVTVDNMSHLNIITSVIPAHQPELQQPPRTSTMR